MRQPRQNPDFIVDLEIPRQGKQRLAARKIIDPLQKWLATTTSRGESALDAPHKCFLDRPLGDLKRLVLQLGFAHPTLPNQSG
jgi:hypothetical protein